MVKEFYSAPQAAARSLDLGQLSACKERIDLTYIFDLLDSFAPARKEIFGVSVRNWIEQGNRSALARRING